MIEGKSCRDCRKREYCKKQCRENKVFMERAIRSKIFEYFAKNGLKKRKDGEQDG